MIIVLNFYMQKLSTKDDLGKLLRMTMAEKQVTALMVAGKAGVTPEYLSELRNGKRNPTFNLLVALLDALDLELIVQPRSK